jgi:agmatine deiminase
MTMPAGLAYRMPAEWDPHAATWLGWPHERTDWPGKFEPVPHLYAEIVRILSKREAVRILAPSKLHAKARDILRRGGALNGNVSLIEAETNRSWTRDFCPTWVRGPGRKKHAVKWRFNGWAKYSNWKKDDAAGELAASVSKAPLVLPDWNGKRVVLEGGSIDVNGDGLLLTTEECLLSKVQERNPGLNREQYEALFEGYLGIRKTIWLGNGIAGDDTHGHVDDLARFVAPRTVVAVVESNRSDPNYAPLQDNLRRLRKAGLKVVELPMPRPVYYDGQRLPASYANFYIANGVVLVPTFHDPNDRLALNTLAKCFPTRDIIGIHCVDMVLGLGTLHCGTMQEPI